MHNNKHFDQDDEVVNVTMFCRNAQVSLYKNINPYWGLYNGAVGIVKDIVYNANESPNNGELPLYILIDFPQYSGPAAFDANIPTFVPITPQECTCNRFCCTKFFIPIKLAYAKTIHTIQGYNVGPTQPGTPNNAIQRIICDPGTKTFEHQNPGLFYTLITRPTTMGDPGDKFSSAIYFNGNNMTMDHILQISLTKQGKLVKKLNWDNNG